MSWLLPETISTFGPEIDRIYYWILWITGIVFVLTEACLIWFLIRYRHKEGRKAEYIHGNMTAEVVWTIIPFLIVIGIAFFSRGIWDEIRNPNSIPANALEIRVEATQFEWNATYPGEDGTLGTTDDPTSRNILRVPVDRPVKVLLNAEDVIHSFFVPALRVKQDAVPGTETPVWFEATETGDYVLACAELCGLGHYRMRGTLRVQSQADFQAWQATQSSSAADQ